MAKKNCKHYSGIGGQAVLEGIMMKNKEHYAVAVRKPDGTIDVEVDNYHGIAHGNKLAELPFIRGVFNFVDSLVLGMKCLNHSASFFDEEESDKTEKKSDTLFTTIVMILSFALAIGLFMILPFFLTSLIEKYVRNHSLLAVLEGVIRIVIFILYVLSISLMKDIRRTYMYHGAEHKCINCIEKGRPLTVHDVMRSSKEHRRCGTSFLLLVMLVSVILFFFIRVDSMLLKVGLRILLIPVIAGISYEILRLAGRSDNFLVRIISAPGMWLQRLTTKEPTEDMVRVAIAAVEAVFDWKAYLKDEFGYEVDETWMDDYVPADEDEDEL